MNIGLIVCITQKLHMTFLHRWSNVKECTKEPNLLKCFFIIICIIVFNNIRKVTVHPEKTNSFLLLTATFSKQGQCGSESI